jgi:hypothetical protein
VLQLFASAAAAQSPGIDGDASARLLAALAARLDGLAKEVETQRQAIDRNTATIDEQRAVIALLRATVGERNPAIQPVTPPSPPPALPGPGPQRPPDLPQRAVTGGDFPGSIEFPGTDTAFKFGGQARATLVHTLQPLGVDDRFITSSIPIGADRAGEAARVAYTAAPSRINLELRSPTPFGGIRTFFEYDFAGDGSTARLRHAFIETNRWTFGQTWSTFTDPEAHPEGIDFEGLNAMSWFRQAQIRYTRPLASRLELALAIENPAPDLTGAEGVNMVPDFIARVRWEPESRARGLFTEVAHVQAAVLGRSLRGQLVGQSEVTSSTGGVGVNISGVLVPIWDAAGRVKFSTISGWGIGRYIKDLEALGGQDAVYDAASGQLRSLGMASGYVGYERRWRSWLQTGFTYGLVHVANLDIQPDSALTRTHRASLSATWNPVSRTDFIGEFLWGERVNKDGARGSSTQIQAGWKVRF